MRASQGRRGLVWPVRAGCRFIVWRGDKGPRWYMIGLWSYDGVEAHGFVNLCCPIGPRQFVRHCVKHGADCGARWCRLRARGGIRHGRGVGRLRRWSVVPAWFCSFSPSHIYVYIVYILISAMFSLCSGPLISPPSVWLWLVGSPVRCLCLVSRASRRIRTAANVLRM